MPEDTFKPDKVCFIDIQLLAENGLVLHTTTGFSLKQLRRALGHRVEGSPDADKSFNNAAHDAWWTVKCMLVQGDLQTGQLPRAYPILGPPSVLPMLPKKRKRGDQEEEDDDDEDDCLKHENDTTDEKNDAASSSTTHPSLDEPSDSPSTHPNTDVPDETFALVDLLTARHAEQSQLQREFMITLDDRMDARDSARDSQTQATVAALQRSSQEQLAALQSSTHEQLVAVNSRTDATQAMMHDITKKVLDMLPNAFSKSTSQSKEDKQQYHATEKRGSARDDWRR